VRALVLVSINMDTKYELPRFTRCIDMSGAQDLKMGHVTLTTKPLCVQNLTTQPSEFLETGFGPQNFIIDHVTPTTSLKLTMVSLRTKCEAFMSSIYEDMKGDTKCRKWGRLC